ncbi:MAG: hypothetical protein AD073_000218 [Mycoplasmataceae bacterium]|nr:MAG: hypothetical protein AD073_000218 [Mycoplasmataceae bacterium]
MKTKKILNKKKSILDFLLIRIPFFSSLFNFLYMFVYPYNKGINENFVVIYKFLKKNFSKTKLNLIVYTIIALFSFIFLELISIFTFRFRKWVLKLNLDNFKIKIINFLSFFLFFLVFINGNALVINNTFLKSINLSFFVNNLIIISLSLLSTERMIDNWRIK